MWARTVARQAAVAAGRHSRPRPVAAAGNPLRLGSTPSCAPRRHESLWTRMFGGEEAIAERRRKHTAKKKRLQKEMQNSGYFRHYAEFQQNKGKRFESSPALLTDDVAPQFPALQCTALSGRAMVLPDDLERHVSLVLVSMRAIAKPIVEAYRDPFTAEFGGKHGCQILQLSVADQWYWRYAEGFLSRQLRKQTPDAQQDRVAVVARGWEPMCRTLDVFQPMSAFAYLVDKRGVVRWTAHGQPTKQELESLVANTRALLGRR